MTAPTVQRLEADRLSRSDRERIASVLGELELDGEASAFFSAIGCAIAEGRELATVAADALLTTTEAAKLLGVSRPTLIRYLDEGRLPSTKTGRDRRVLTAHVLAYVTERDRQSELLAQARREARTLEEQLAQDLGLSREEAEELGIL